MGFVVVAHWCGPRGYAPGTYKGRSNLRPFCVNSAAEGLSRVRGCFGIRLAERLGLFSKRLQLRLHELSLNSKSLWKILGLAELVRTVTSDFEAMASRALAAKRLVDRQLNRSFAPTPAAWRRSPRAGAICRSINHAALFCSGGRSSLTRITLNSFPKKFT
jgi:hypothetical protein